MIGMIYLQINQPFQCGYVQLDVESEEKAEFTRFYHKTEHYTDNEGNHQTRSVEHSERVEDKHEGFEFKANLFDLSAYNKMFNVGNYAIQFQFELPSPLPSTLKMKNSKDRAKPEAKVEHRVKIKLKDTQFDDSPQFRKEFKVRNDALLAKGGIPNQEKSEDVVTCCCCSQGKIDMKAQFEREFFYKD
jgi:hypothetical protein